MIPITRIPAAEIASPEKKDLVQIFKACWWVVDKDDRVLFVRGRSPQCNFSEKIARDIQQRSYPDHDIKLIEFAYVPISVPSGDFIHDV